MQEPQPKPYLKLGTHLKTVRERAQETIAEVAGAVEIDASMLEQIESGEERPSEEILMLMINHFGIQDNDAVTLWETAGYDRMPEPHGHGRGTDLASLLSNGALVVALQDNKVAYTDGVDIAANRSGLTMEFKQSSGNKNQTVAKVGMSYEQAKMMLEALQMTLLKSGYQQSPRRLNPPQDQS